MGLFGRDRYQASNDSETCEHPNQSVEDRTSTDRKGRQNVTRVAYCPNCGAEWSAPA